MELLDNFKSLFLSVWDRGLLGVDIFQILIGIGIFLIFLIFRGIISNVVIKRLENLAKKTTNKLDDAFVQAMIGPARFLPIVLGFFIASYYMSFSEDGRAVVDTINRTLITRSEEHTSELQSRTNLVCRLLLEKKKKKKKH